MENEFSHLNPAIQKWVYRQGWDDLRDIQKRAIRPVLSRKTDIILCAATAGGKTEAAFLPACSSIANENNGFRILYISPLKALINDQYRRLESLCNALDMTVTPWHGDSPQSKKENIRRDPKGILLITPESLESLLMRKAGWVKASFESLKYIIVDEYHAFIGFDRGHHLQSLMHRLEKLLDLQGDFIPRIALSATLGNMDDAKSYLRPDKAHPCELIKESEDGPQNKNSLKVQIRGYINRSLNEFNSPEELAAAPPSVEKRIALDLYTLFRGNSHLIFANSRNRTEYFAAMLRDLCEENFVPNEFFPHHGSLSKELREQVEARLQKETLPTTAVCTMTLELGIDIGKVKSIAQVTAPHSVASLRQRLGRSGRRGDPSILRMFITENKLTATSSIVDKLRMELLQSIAMVHLLVDKWYEPPDVELFHFSTLTHQILAVIYQWGGVRADQLWELLCKTGPFKKVTLGQFKSLLLSMGERRLIAQISSGELVIGDQGEKLVSHYTFYAVFKTPEEYRIISKGKTLGTIPVDSMILVAQHIVFGGKRWVVKNIDTRKKSIHVVKTEKGDPPRFGGNGMSVHDRVRQEMLKIYSKGDYKIKVKGATLEFLDPTARELFLEGLNLFQNLNLENKYIVEHGEYVYIIPWMGDKIVNTLFLLLKDAGYKASSFAGIIEVIGSTHLKVQKSLKSFTTGNDLSNAQLATLVKNKQTEKYDYLLPEDILNEDYGAKAFDIHGTINWIKKAIHQNYI